MGQPSPGHADGAGRRVAVVVARFNHHVTDRLKTGAVDALRQAGVAETDIEVVDVPGAFELPLASKWLAESGRFDAVVALGAVIHGDTDHYDYVCQGATAGILDAGLATGVPIGFGVLTCQNEELALQRAGGKAGNKGADTALAALEMAALQRRLRG